MSDQLTAFIRDAMPMCTTLGARCRENTPERVVLELDWRADLCTMNGLLHGGAVMALADAAGGACAFANLPPGAAGTSTIESKTNFMRGLSSGVLVATSTPLHVGSTTIVVETELRDGAGKLVAKTTQTQAVLRPR